MAINTPAPTTALAPATVEHLKNVVDQALANMTEDGLVTEDGQRLVKAAEYILAKSNKFNPHAHLQNIGSQNKPNMYLPVQYRLVWFRELCPEGTIHTEIVTLDLETERQAERGTWNAEKRRMEKVTITAPGLVIFRAVVEDGNGGRASATKMETAAAFDDFIEKAETGAVGRALAMLGYGTQFVGDEMAEGSRLADSPVNR